MKNRCNIKSVVYIYIWLRFIVVFFYSMGRMYFQFLYHSMVGRQLQTSTSADTCEVIIDESHLADIRGAVALMVDLFKVKFDWYLL